MLSEGCNQSFKTALATMPEGTYTEMLERGEYRRETFDQK